MQINVIDNGNITSHELNKRGLHLNPRGLGKLGINFIRRMKKIVRIRRVTGSFHKASSFDSEVNSTFFANLRYTEKSDKSAINQLNGTYSKGTLKKEALHEIR